MERKAIIAWFLILHHLLPILKLNAGVPALIVFGDSSVDTGNNNQISTIAKSNFKPYGRDFYGGQATGRFCNGRISADFISDAFGLKPIVPAYLDPAYNISEFASGVSFASAGSGFDNATANVLSVIPLWEEVEYYKNYQEELRSYLGKEKANFVLGEALYLISIGTNDFLENYFTIPGRSKEYSIEGYQNFLIGIAQNFIAELYQSGARKISLGGLPPMGCLPLERTRNIFSKSVCYEKYNNVAQEFNEKLKGLVTNLSKEFVGIQLVFSNTFDIFSQIIQNPESFGFKNVVEACCGTGLFEMGYLCSRNNPLTCSDPNQYVFWDAFHPTEKTYEIMSCYVVKNFLARFL